MNKRDKNHWLLFPEFFIRLTGAEYLWLRQAGMNALMRFYIAGVSIFLIFGISLFGIWYAIDMLFDSLLIDVFLSIIFAFLFSIIYIFLLQTFTKQNLAQGKSKFNLSNILRLGFIIFISFLVSRTIEIYIWRQELGKEIKPYKAKMLDDYARKISALFQPDIQKIETGRNYYLIQSKRFLTESYNNEIDALSRQKEGLVAKEIALLNIARTQIENSPFFIHRIKMVNRIHIYSWLFCIAIIAFFLFPGYLIYSISCSNEYFRIKKTYETDKIHEEHGLFLRRFHSLFLVLYREPVEHYTVYEDPPFNTMRKFGPKFEPNSDFLKRYFSEE